MIWEEGKKMKKAKSGALCSVGIYEFFIDNIVVK
jgi:hypothetical protein